jgi:protein-S-isoprenylcysteine O-methyltransferase Ste14
MIIRAGEPMIRLQAAIQSILFLILLAATLFGAAGQIAVFEFWAYLAIVAAASLLALIILDTDLIKERMRVAGRRVELHFYPVMVLLFCHWATAGFDRGRLHVGDTVPAVMAAIALGLYAAAWLVWIWAMHVNRFFSSTPRIQAERGHQLITSGPYRFVRHPGYAAAFVAALVSGIGLGSWLATLFAPVAIAMLLWRTTVEDRLLRDKLPGYDEYAKRVRYRLFPGIW